MKRKSDLQVIDEMLGIDIALAESGTPLTPHNTKVQCYPTVSRANGYQKSGELTFGVAPGVVQDLHSGKKRAILYVIDSEEFRKIKNAPQDETHSS